MNLYLSNPLPDIWLPISEHLDEQSLLALSACCHDFHRLMRECIFNALSAMKVAQYQNAGRALGMISNDFGPFGLIHWCHCLDRWGTEEVDGYMHSFTSSISRQHNAMALEFMFRTVGRDVYTILTKIALDMQYHGLARHLLGRYDWSKHGREIGRLLAAKELHGLLAFCYAQGYLPSRLVFTKPLPSTDILLIGNERVTVTIPPGYEGGFYLAPREFLCAKSYYQVFLESQGIRLMMKREYYVIKHVYAGGCTVPDPVYNYSLLLKEGALLYHNRESIVPTYLTPERILYFDSLELVRGLKLFCEVLGIDWKQHWSVVHSHVTGKDVVV